MSFLDNLENTLKALEGRESEAADPRAAERREAERAQALAAAPWAEKLKTEPYTQALLDGATLAGHRLRAKVYITWLGSTLRLEARGRKLELRATPDGVLAVFIEENAEVRSERLDLAGDPQELVNAWLG